MDKKPWLNPYHYCSNNPVGKTDPSGKKDRPFNGKKDKRITIQEGTETYVTYELNDKGKPVFSKKSQKDSYNCHSYAWHKSQGDPNPATSDIPKINGSYLPRWDENPADDIKEQKARQLGKNENNLPGDIVIYYTDYNGNGQYDDDEPISHSAVVKEVDEEGFTIVVIGKMGQGPISINHPDAPDYYKIDENGKETSRAYFRRPATTDTTNN
jgi:hypothetical protein